MISRVNAYTPRQLYSVVKPTEQKVQGQSDLPESNSLHQMAADSETIGSPAAAPSFNYANEPTGSMQKQSAATHVYDRAEPTAIEGRRKLTAMRIALRIASGDKVPWQDHKFLAEYDAGLYRAALKASLSADKEEPEDHDSLVDEMAAEESKFNDAESANSSAGDKGESVSHFSMASACSYSAEQ